MRVDIPEGLDPFTRELLDSILRRICSYYLERLPNASHQFISDVVASQGTQLLEVWRQMPPAMLYPDAGPLPTPEIVEDLWRQLKPTVDVTIQILEAGLGAEASASLLGSDKAELN